MPEEIEQAFISNGLNLFPYSLAEVESVCSCPDQANPCKHIGALYYQLAERFAEDPFILFQLRGRTKQDILEGIRLQMSHEVKEISISPKLRTVSSNPAVFWRNTELFLTDFKRDEQSFSQRTILDLLGRIPLPQEEADALEVYLKQVYYKVAKSEEGKISIASPKE
jgi:uncharacterized Zn finger protein